MNNIRYILVFLFVVSVVFTTQADDANNFKVNDTAVWQKRQEEAIRDARKAFQPDPESVLNSINDHANNSSTNISNTNEEGRALLGKLRSQRCEVTNPIDRCWRCQKNWSSNRKRLADCALGFGHRVTGGKAGRIYVVTDPSDHDLRNPRKGTLRHAVIQKEPLWIIFARDMTIRLSQELIMASHKTIDGRGAQIHIANGAGFTLQFIKNVIIHNIRIHDIKKGNGGLIRDSVDHFGFRTQSDGDAISIFGSSNIWIDHVSLSKADDGLIDIIQGSTAITISNCHFAYHYEALLFGASDSHEMDKIMQVTLAFNHFGKGLDQRLPRVRFGFAHILNNVYTRWQMYAIGGSAGPTILSEGNDFYAPDNAFAKQITKRDYAPESVWKNWVWKSNGDVMRNGAFFKQSGNLNHRFASDGLSRPFHGKYARWLTKYAGPLKCAVHRGC